MFVAASARHGKGRYGKCSSLLLGVAAVVVVDVVAVVVMMWEEFVEDEETGLMTSTSLIEWIHSHSATLIENYMAWRLLKAEVGYVFFKELKENGGVFIY
jgi:hypothetical protein